MKRVVITGTGLVTCLGQDVEKVWSAVLKGESGVRVHPEFADVDGLRVRIAAPVLDFEPQKIPRKFRRSMSKMAMFAASAAQDAFDQAKFPMETLSSGRVGIVAGSTTGSPEAMREFFAEFVQHHSIRQVSSTMFLRVMSHTVPAHLALVFGITGPVHSPSCACAVSNQAIGIALDMIRSGRVDAVLCGGADEISVLGIATFDVVNAACRGYEDDPGARPAPFESSRDGVVIGEGASMLVLESLEHAQARGATILAEVLGYGESCDASHMSSPEATGMQAAMERALRDAQRSPQEIDYVCAHATGTQVGDATEAEATWRVFGEAVPVSSLKGHFGHTLAACGGLEAVLCVLAMRDGWVPATRNLRETDVAPVQLPREPMRRQLNNIVSNNFAFGGINASLVLGRAPRDFEGGTGATGE